ncbi:exo-alpha-sialidase [Saccharicrinis sp. FJH54]|uniref:sialidase family protein n=1 Tax=Saccharicrinis sp. FJH54 TaxID=3344665 RepID=UPI0035D41BF4
MNSEILTVTLLSIVTISLQAMEGRWKKGIVDAQFLYEKDVYPSCHAGTLAETPDGLVAAWFGGTYERHPDVTIRFSKFKNGKWSKSVEVANGVINDTLRYPTWNPVLYQVPGGDLLLFYKVGPKPSEWWGVMKRSSDNGETWSEAQKLPDGYIGPVKNKPVLLEDGTLICPSSTEGNGWNVHFEFTKDWGKTWDKTDAINNYKVHSIIQPSVLTYPDGRLQILCRSKNAVLVTSWSDDNGKTWSLTQPSGLPNNNSGTDAVTLADGRQLVVYNHVATPINASKGHRTPLNVAVSKDGKTWYAALVLEDSEISQYSYPAVIQTSDGLVHIIYTWRREKMKHVVVDPDKLKLSKIVDEKWPEK